jgi:Predicted signal-transduction protein containing cAMP-binding and CBS domains
MKISTLMIPDPPISDSEEMILTSLRKVRDRGIGRVIVADKVVKGIVSTRDLISFFVSNCAGGCREREVSSMASIRISQVMSRDPITVSLDDDLMDALSIMVARNFGSLPVADRERRPRGLITERELLLAYRDVPEVLHVSNFMSKKVSTVEEQEPLIDAAARMVRRGFRRLPVVREGQVVGMLTAADVLKKITEALLNGNPGTLLSAKVADTMNHRVIAVEPDATLQEVATTLVQKKIGSLLVMERGNLVGIITERDLLLALHYLLYLKATRGKMGV